jgi:hypothetical protein
MKRLGSTFHGGYLGANKQFLVQLPIRAPNFDHPPDKTAHERMIRLVDNMQSLHDRLASAKSGAHRRVVQRQIESTDREIDRMVYDLYGLTEEEIAIVEGNES